MRSLKTRRTKGGNRKTTQKTALLLFLLGVAFGLTFSIFLKIERKPQVYPKKIPAGPKIAIPEVTRPVLPKIAIVLDDFGYNYKNVEAVFRLERPITFSILPNHVYSKTIARRVHQKGYEAILHLPLEPYREERYIRPELNTINVGMNKEEIANFLDRSIETTSYIIGVSNHQGSKATESPELIRLIFAELKKRGLSFLDTLVSNKSVCKKIAKEKGVRFYQRDVFLDNETDFEYIKGQMQQLVKKAKRRGYAIGIGHDREKTVSALSELMPEAEKEGVEFVFLSELIK